MTLPHTEHHIPTPAGTLFAARWMPEGAAANAPTIILFHDSLGCTALWRDFPARLAEASGLPVLAYDRIGFGRSDAAAGPVTPDFVAAEAEANIPALREALRVDRFVAFGHSVGGGMAIVTAAMHPESCVAVITEAAQCFVEDRTLTGIREAQAMFALPGQMERLARHHGDKAAWVLEAWTGTWLSPRFAGWTLDAVLPRLRCPLLAIHGDRDEYGSRVHPERIVAGAGGAARMQWLEDCGHVPHRERPEEVLALVRDFLADRIRP